MTALYSANAQENLPHERSKATDQQRRRAAGALRALRQRRVSNDSIRALLSSLREEAGVQKMVQSWPSLGEERALLEEIAQQAQTLANNLDRLRPTTTQRISLRVLQLSDQIRAGRVQDLSEALRILDPVARELGKAVPRQSRARSRIGIVSRVWKVLGRDGECTLSDDQASRFYGFCEQAFILVGASTGSADPKPAGAIRAFKKLIAPK